MISRHEDKAKFLPVSPLRINHDLMDQIVFATQRTLPSNCRFKLKFLLRGGTRLYSVLIMFSPLGWTEFKYVIDTLYSLKISRDNVSDKEKLNDAVRYNLTLVFNATHQQILTQGLLWDLKSPKVALSRLKSP